MDESDLQRDEIAIIKVFVKNIYIYIYIYIYILAVIQYIYIYIYIYIYVYIYRQAKSMNGDMLTV